MCIVKMFKNKERGGGLSPSKFYFRKYDNNVVPVTVINLKA